MLCKLMIYIGFRTRMQFVNQIIIWALLSNLELELLEVYVGNKGELIKSRCLSNYTQMDVQPG